MQLSSVSQRGFGLISVMVAILITTILGVLAAGKVIQTVNDAAAEATGTYLMNIRGALLKTLSEHMYAYSNTDISGAQAGTYPPAPAWATFSGNSTIISVKDLKDFGLLRKDFPDAPPLGRSAQIKFVRSGTCPGSTCSVEAYVYTCWPVNSRRPSGNVTVTSCPAQPAGWEYDSALVAAVVQATEGNGGSNTLDSKTVKGSLFNISATDLDIPSNSPGHVAVLASLNNTMFDQFVRQGDTRHIYLNDQLTGDKQIETKAGALLNTSITLGAACDTEGLYATSSRQTFAVCRSGHWFELVSHVLAGIVTLSNGERAPTPVCPTSNMRPFYVATLSGFDNTITGGNLLVHGSQSGSISGSGQTSATGQVSVDGSFSGTFTSDSSSSIRVAQSVSVDGDGLVTITPAGTNNRAMVILGCVVKW